MRVPATGVWLCRCTSFVSGSHLVNGLMVGTVGLNWGAAGQGLNTLVRD